MTPTPAPHDIAVYIGRFQPFHNGHLAVLQEALAVGKKVVLVMGSAFQARSPKNPFTWQERAAMIRMSLSAQDWERVIVVPVRDYYDDARWVRAVREGVEAVSAGARSIGLVGHFKDASSYYLSRFSGWQLHECPRQADIDATDIRRVLFDTPEQASAGVFALLGSLVPTGVREYLAAWWSLPYAKQLAADAVWLADYRSKWTADVYNAADSVVVCNGHVLLIQRGRGQGAGLYAVPGGFMEKDQRFYETAVRELREETGFGMLGSSLDGYLKGSALFDHPHRSLRARIISMAFHFELGKMRLPEVKGADDARSAQWVPVPQLSAMEDQFFEDHFHILDHFLKLTR